MRYLTRDHFGVASVTEDEAFQFVIDHYFQRQLYAAIAETLLHFL